MGGRSKIDQLPPEVRREINDLIDYGLTVSEITDHLKELREKGKIGDEISRASVGRYTKRIEAFQKRLRVSREVSSALVKEFGERPQNDMLQLNIELMQPVIMDLLAAEDGEEVRLDAKEVMFLSSALKNLADAAKKEAERIMKVRKEAVEETAKKAAEAVDQVINERGLTAQTVEDIKKQILGITQDGA